jgi:hypothetical protein
MVHIYGNLSIVTAITVNNGTFTLIIITSLNILKTSFLADLVVARIVPLLIQL